MDIVTQIFTIIIRAVIAVAAAVVAYYVKKDVVPWLIEKRIYSSVQNAVKATEKLAETGKIDKRLKKQYAKKILGRFGIYVTPTVDAMIEAAVEEIDEAKGYLGNILIGETCETEEEAQEDKVQ